MLLGFFAVSKRLNLYLNENENSYCDMNRVLRLNTWINSLLPVQEDASITTLMTEQETLEENLL